MVQKYSIAHLTSLGSTPLDLITYAAKAGFDSVSLRMTAVTPDEPLYPLISSKSMMRETKAALADTGLSVLDVELVRLDADTEPEPYEAFLEAGRELGARAVIVQLPDPDRQRATDRFARFCDMAAQYDMTANLEFPSWTETPDLKSAMQVVSAVDKTNAGILIDTLHFDRSGASLQDLKDVPREWFNFIHLCDAPKEHPLTHEGILFTAREERFIPGSGGLKLKEILACMPQVPISLEIPNDKMLKELGAEEYIRRVLRGTKAFMETVIFEKDESCRGSKKPKRPIVTRRASTDKTTHLCR